MFERSFVFLKWIYLSLFLTIVLFSEAKLWAGPPTSSHDPYSRGVSLFQAKSYAAALPLFQQVIRKDSSNAMAYYYLGSCLETVGDFKGEALYYYLSNKLSPDPGLKAYADKVMDNLSLEDQSWVENQLNGFSKLPISSPVATGTQPPAAKDGFGLRVGSHLAFFTLADFQTELATVNSDVQGFQAANPSYNYKDPSTLPSAALVLEFTPYFKFEPGIELGILFGYWMMESPSFVITDIHPQYFVHSTWDFNSAEFALEGKLELLPADPKGIQIYLQPLLGFQPISIHWTDNYQNTSSSPSANQIGAQVGSTALEAGLNLGATFPMGKVALFSISGGYRRAAASGFTGAWSDAGVPTLNGTSGSLEMYKSPSTGKSSIIFIPDSPNLLSAFNENQNTLAASRPLSVDFSGLRFSADVSFIF